MSKSIYLIAYYTITPKERVRTAQPGWMDNPNNVSWNEQIAIARKVKPRDLQMAKVILDLGNRTVYRNTWRHDVSFDDLFEHFYNGYQKYLDPVIKELGYEMVEKSKVNEEVKVVDTSTISNATISSI